MALKEELKYLLQLQAQVAAPEPVQVLEAAHGHVGHGPLLAGAAGVAAAAAVDRSTAIDFWLDQVIATLDARYVLAAGGGEPE